MVSYNRTFTYLREEVTKIITAIRMQNHTEVQLGVIMVSNYFTRHIYVCIKVTLNRSSNNVRIISLNIRYKATHGCIVYIDKVTVAVLMLSVKSLTVKLRQTNLIPRRKKGIICCNMTLSNVTA